VVLCVVGICQLLAAKRQRYVDSSDEDRSDELLLSRSEFVMEDALKFKVDATAETLRGQDLVDYVNRKQDLWTAQLNRKFENYDANVKWRLMGVNHVHNSVKARKHLAKSRFMDIELPKNFDARTNWPDCASLRTIRDQSSCGSCWAFGAVEAMSDRICIASKGQLQVSISAADLLSCCKSCGFGCDGGDPLAAWKYWVSDGIVTGSNFTAHAGCKPYPFPPCEHHSNKTHYQPCKHDLFPTPKCEKKCQNSYNEKTYDEDKFFGRKAFAVEDDVESIQKELFTNGPLEVAFEVYDDFLHYSGGIYIHTGGHLGGGHAVKLVGWGEDNGIPYWTVANSWNSDWGEDGFFRILRGKDECGIESGVVGGLPDLKRSIISEREYNEFY
jgi:cathepsin B